MTTKKDNKVNVVNVVTQAAIDDEVIVEINNMQIRAMMDTGAYPTMLKYKEYVRISKPELRSVVSTFQGFGNAIVKANGVFRAIATIQGEKYDVEIPRSTRQCDETSYASWQGTDKTDGCEYSRRTSFDQEINI